MLSTLVSTLEKLQTFDATKTIESTPVGLNPSAALSEIEGGLIDPVKTTNLFRASNNSGSEEHSVPLSNSWWTDAAMEGLSYEEVKILNDIASYRAQNGLDMPSVSKSLTAVAKIHAEDLSRNNPDRAIRVICIVGLTKDFGLLFVTSLKKTTPTRMQILCGINHRKLRRNYLLKLTP